jgi:ABC-2 type transport system ATP-binding protein
MDPARATAEVHPGGRRTRGAAYHRLVTDPQLRPDHLRVSGLTKVFGGRVRANDGISFRLAGGQVVGILGPNGAGKSTLLRQIVGLMRPTAGAMEILGRPVAPRAGWLREEVAYLPQHPLALLDLTVFEAVWTTAALRGQPPRTARARALQVLETLGLADLRGRLVAQLSGGEHRLVTIAAAVVAPTPLMALDEPSNDLDPLMRRRVWALIAELRHPGRLILLVSHNVLEAEAVVDRVLILHRGRLFAAGTPESLRRERGSGVWLEIRYRGGSELLGEVGPPAGAAGEDVYRLRWWLSRPEAEHRLAALLGDTRGGRLLDVSLREPTLEELYLSYRDAMGADEAPGTGMVGAG